MLRFSWNVEEYRIIFNAAYLQHHLALFRFQIDFEGAQSAGTRIEIVHGRETLPKAMFM